MSLVVRNLWVQHDWDVACWYADVTAILPDPQRLLSLLQRILAVGNEHEIFITEPAYAAERRARWDEKREIDLDLIGDRDVHAKVAWFGTAGDVVEDRVADLGELLRALHPSPESIWKSSSEIGWHPLAISGACLRYQGEPPTTIDASGSGTIRFALRSDIWFPFINGFEHPWRLVSYGRWSGPQHFFDNRELARRHTPRLNRFLVEVSAAVIEAGGSWSVDPDENALLLRPWIGPHGVLLDGPVPSLMPPEALSFDWSTPEEEVEALVLGDKATHKRIWPKDAQALRGHVRLAIHGMRSLPADAPRVATMWIPEPRCPFHGADRATLLGELRGQVKLSPDAADFVLRFETGHPDAPFEIAGRELL